jgi:hypothetical protein
MKRNFIIAKVGIAPDRTGDSLYQIFYEIGDDVYEAAEAEQLRGSGFEKNEPMRLNKAMFMLRKLKESNK